MKMKITPAILFLAFSAMVVLIFSCKTSSDDETTTKQNIRDVDITTADKELEAEILRLEAEAPSKEMNTLSRNSSGAGSGYNFDDECNSRCESILDKQNTIHSSATLEKQHRECIQRCMEEKAKQLAKEEADKEKNQVKEFILQQAQENFQRCINDAQSEEDKKDCRERYIQDKEFYYNYGK